MFFLSGFSRIVISRANCLEAHQLKTEPKFSVEAAEKGVCWGSGHPIGEMQIPTMATVTLLEPSQPTFFGLTKKRKGRVVFSVFMVVFLAL